MTAPTKIPIDPSEIRFGDLIRWESPNSVNAREFRQTDPHSRHTKPGAYYLLDRPTSPVTLPTEPTLGWLTYAGSTIFGEFRKYGPADYKYDDGMKWDATEILDGKVHNSLANVTAFTPATAVPTDALNELRKYRNDLDWDCATPAVRRIDAFLAAVDEATS